MFISQRYIIFATPYAERYNENLRRTATCLRGHLRLTLAAEPVAVGQSPFQPVAHLVDRHVAAVAEKDFVNTEYMSESYGAGCQCQTFHITEYIFRDN